jgi:hypothetical protein
MIQIARKEIDHYHQFEIEALIEEVIDDDAKAKKFIDKLFVDLYLIKYD